MNLTAALALLMTPLLLAVACDSEPVAPPPPPEPLTWAERLGSLGDDLDPVVAQCDSGNSQSCSDLAESLLPSGLELLNPDLPTPPHYDVAVELQEIACDDELWGACLRLGILLSNQRLNREPRRRELARATRLFQFLCDRGDTDACFHGARHFLSRGGDVSAGLQTLGPLCSEHDNALACDEIIRLVEEEGESADWLALLEAHRNRCERMPRRCLELGVMLAMGQRVPRDVSEGYRHFVTACEAGVMHGCLNAGMAVFNEGLASPEEGAALWARACDGDHAEACLRLGGLYYHGEPLPRDEARSLTYLQRACELGLQEGCDNIQVLCELPYAPACEAAQ